MYWNTEQRFFVSVKKQLLHTFTAKDSVVKLEFTKSGTDIWFGVLKWQHFKKIKYFSCLKFNDSWLFFLIIFFFSIHFKSGFILTPYNFPQRICKFGPPWNLNRFTARWGYLSRCSHKSRSKNSKLKHFPKNAFIHNKLVLLTSFAWQALSSLAVVPFNFMSF